MIRTIIFLKLSMFCIEELPIELGLKVSIFVPLNRKEVHFDVILSGFDVF